MFTLRLIGGVLLSFLIFAVPLFLLAGTLNWWRAWVLVSVILIGTAGSVAALARGHRELLEERLKSPIQKEQPLSDKIVVTLLLISFLGMLVMSALDIFRLHLLAQPGPLASSLGLALTVVGWWIAYLAMSENTFAAPVVKHQVERHHTVTDMGLYRIIRHPMYAGGALVMIGVPLWLKSYAGTLVGGVAVATLIARILVEERFLRRELEGYESYVHRVRYRLIPFVW